MGVIVSIALSVNAAIGIGSYNSRTYRHALLGKREDLGLTMFLGLRFFTMGGYITVLPVPYVNGAAQTTCVKWRR
jgi:hypothetical protein